MCREGMPFAVGDKVVVYCKYCPWNAAEKFMVAKSFVAGTQFPRSGRSDGWVHATVVEVSDRNPKDAILAASGIAPGPTGEWVRVQFSDKIWTDSKGAVLEERSLFEWKSADSVLIAQNVPSPDSSVLVVRWGGQVAVDGARFDFAVSDKLIQDCMQALHEKFGTKLEIFTVYVSSSSDLRKVNELWASEALCNGKQRAALYFLWGCNNDSKPGYVLSADLTDLMERMESVGVVTRYPNHSQLYKAITSKEYQATLCTNTQLAIPPCVAVPASLILANMAGDQLASLSLLKESVWGSADPVTDGVVKVGHEWMGDGVRSFSGSTDLAGKLQVMLEGSHGRPPCVLVQDRVKHVVVEPRLFVFKGQVKGIRYTWNTKHDSRTGRIHGLRTCSQAKAADERFNGDLGAQQFVERRLAYLVNQWNMWLLASSSESPSFVRMDFLVEKLAAGDTPGAEESNGGEEEWNDVADEPADAQQTNILPQIGDHPDDKKYQQMYRVWTCELGEIGSSMVSFREGRDLLFQAVADSCAPSGPKRPSRPPPRV